MYMLIYNMIALGGRGKLSVFDTHGNLLWEEQLVGGNIEVAAHENLIVSGAQDGNLTCWDTDGNELWMRRLDKITAVTITKKKVLATTSDGYSENIVNAFTRQGEPIDSLNPEFRCNRIISSYQNIVAASVNWKYVEVFDVDRRIIRKPKEKCFYEPGFGEHETINDLSLYKNLIAIGSYIGTVNERMGGALHTFDTKNKESWSIRFSSPVHASVYDGVVAVGSGNDLALYRDKTKIAQKILSSEIRRVCLKDNYLLVAHWGQDDGCPLGLYDLGLNPVFEKKLDRVWSVAIF